ncbi:MAG: oligosaccharide flippase family protein [Saprospiraceae bacterium]|nr:oligosaccharide flippase family protein [Saprospiraceae bacterium]MBK8851337.1 oligosaccharide flippase family protein [Saprospiraceae bacterium]
MSKPVKVLALAMGDGINLVLNFILVPILARLFDIETYGTYGQVLMVAGFWLSFLSMGLNTILLRDLAQTDNKVGVFGNNLMSGFLLGTMGTITLWVAAPYLQIHFNNAGLAENLRWYSLFIPFTIAIGSCNAALIFLGKSRKIVGISVFINAARLVGIIALVTIFGHSLKMIFGYLTLLSVLQFLLLMRNIDWHFSMDQISKVGVQKQITEAWPLGLTIIISSMFTVADGFFVSSMLDVHEYAIYRNGAMYLPLIMNLFAAINSIILPDVSRMFISGDWVKILELKKNIANIFVYVVYPVLLYFIFFGRDLVSLIYSEKYVASALVFQIYNISLLFRFCNSEDLFLAANKTRILPVIYACVCLYAFLANYLLIGSLGMQGAAVAALSGTLALMFMVYYFGFKIINYSLFQIIPFKAIGRVLLLTAPLILFCSFGTALWDETWIFLFLFAPYIFFCYVFMLRSQWLDPVMVRNLLASVFGSGKLIRIYDIVVR